MAAVNEESIEKKFQSVNNAQDSIQSLSLWVIHHKSHHKQIVDIWLNVLKKAKISHRLTLFYLCNDVVQNSKRKQAAVYLQSFQNILKEAIPFVRDDSIQKKIARIFTIWDDRKVFPSNFTSELESILSSSPITPSKPESDGALTPTYKPTPANATRPSVNPKLLAEFKPQDMIEKINKFRKIETEADMKQKFVAHLKIDAASLEAVKLLKDRAHGKEFSKQFEDSCSKLEDFIKLMERVKESREALTEELRQSEFFYDEQYREAKIVAHAYKNFGTRIGNMKKKLDDLIKTLPDPLSPIPSPSMDAPSPGSTPPLDPDRDIQTVDMDMSDEEEEPFDSIISTSLGSVAHTTTTKSISKPILSVREIKIEGLEDGYTNDLGLSDDDDDRFKPNQRNHLGKRKFPPEDTLEKRIADILPNLPLGSSLKKEHKHRRKSKDKEREEKVYNPKMRSVVAKVIYNPPKLSQQHSSSEDEAGTPLTDERPSTPVQDENPPAVTSSASMPQKVNPIDFLSKLISQTQKTPPVNSNSSFLQSLTQLTTGMMPKSEQKPLNGIEGDQSLAAPQSWAAWKRENQPDTPPPPIPVPIPPPGAVPIGVPPPSSVPPIGVIPPPVKLGPPTLGPPSPNLLPLQMPQPNFASPPPGVSMSPHYPIDFPPPSHGTFYPHTSPGQKENWPAASNVATAGMPQQLQNVSVIVGAAGNRSSRLLPGHEVLDTPHGQDLTSPPSFHPPSASTKPIKGILRNVSQSVLKEVPLVPSQDSDNQSSSPSPQTPRPPSQPPTPVEFQTQPVFPEVAASSVNSDADFLEFSEKLKRKTAIGVSIPSTLPESRFRQAAFRVNPSNPNLMTLTPEPPGEESVATNLEGDVESSLDDRLEEEPSSDEAGDEMKGKPIGTLSTTVQQVKSLGGQSEGSKSLQSTVVAVVEAIAPPFNRESASQDFDERRFHNRRDNSHYGSYPPVRDSYYRGQEYNRYNRQPYYSSSYNHGGRRNNQQSSRPQYASYQYDNRYYRY